VDINWQQVRKISRKYTYPRVKILQKVLGKINFVINQIELLKFEGSY